MGGKSTYMRQTALIVLLAHVGCFVPAKRAEIGPVDRIFTRIGAADDLAQGRSTFMVEMSETANILHHATEHSLVLVDEIGRGTSTYDGMALAYATALTLARDIRAMTLFATHFFDLTRLTEVSDSVCNVHVSVSEVDGTIAFLHQIKEGKASQSYGLHVAKLAGMPQHVLKLAQDALQTVPGKTQPQHPVKEIEVKPHPLSLAVSKLNLDTLSPKEALDILYELKTNVEV